MHWFSKTFPKPLTNNLLGLLNLFLFTLFFFIKTYTRYRVIIRNLVKK